ncbi:MAG: penicillin acylase family protein, partial [Candidatus Hydrogenedentota bacterium]
MRASLAKLAEEQAPKASGPLPGEGEDAGKTVIYRDTWGVAHIYAPTIEAGLYAQGYAIAEDRPELLLTNFMTAIGELASIKGKDAIQSDLRSHMWDHYGMAKALADRNRPEIRSHLQAFAAGINEFYAQHPKDAPEWWGGRRVDEAMIVAFGRLFLFNWSIDEAYGDLERGGIKPGFDPVQRGSNQWAVSPARSASKNAL